MNARGATAALAEIVRAGHRLIVTHGNGPQVGLLALQQLNAATGSIAPLDLLDAESEGMIGYLIEQELENALRHEKPVVTLLTQVEVDREDPAFARPTKFIGPMFRPDEANDFGEALGWAMAQDGQYWRRVVPSPEPLRVPDLDLVRVLIEHGAIVICAGGGGIPVTAGADGSMEGVEAVVDKDRVSALVAAELGADALLLLTDVDAVYRDWNGPRQSAIGRIAAGEAELLDLPEGSMGPKVQSACRFVRAGGAFAGIGALADALEILEQEKGTIVTA